MKPIIISGKIGSGKSTVCKLFEKKGYILINSDSIAKRLITQNPKIQKSLIENFNGLILENNTLSLNKLRSLLCSSRENKEIIDSIVHPVFYDELNELVSNSTNHKTVIEIPLIETCSMLDMEYILVFVKTNRGIREKRYLLREDSDKNIFDKLNKYQTNTSISTNISDYIINNDDNMDKLVINFNQLYKYLKNE